MDIEKQRSIFNNFHDGTIVDIKKDNSNYKLEIEILYLAEALNKDFKSYFVELIDCSTICFLKWESTKPITDTLQIIKMEPDILRCSSDKNDSLEIVCDIFDRSGGILQIETNNIKIYDHSHNELSPEKLDTLSSEYWDNLGKRCKKD